MPMCFTRTRYESFHHDFPARIVEHPKISVLVPPPPPPPTELLHVSPVPPRVVFAEPPESRRSRTPDPDLEYKADLIAERIANENMRRNQEAERAERQARREIKRIALRFGEEDAARKRIDEEYRREVNRENTRYWSTGVMTKVSRSRSYYEQGVHLCAACGRRGHRAMDCVGEGVSYRPPTGRVRYLDSGL